MKYSGTKKRLDLVLLDQRPELSRSRVQAEIMAGRVRVDGAVCDKPGTPVDLKAAITVDSPANPYVSRGGLKLEAALKDLDINVEGLVVLDVGASTGGFTDCLLQKGAVRVYALDVGYGQLDYSLRDDDRVVNMERFNIRNLKPGDLFEVPDLAVIDVSFISLDKVVPVISSLKVQNLLTLVKPQFEAGHSEASRGKGVIRDAALHREVLLEKVTRAQNTGYKLAGMAYSRYPGPKGNIEYFVHYSSCPVSLEQREKEVEGLIAGVVEEAHRSFNS